MAELKTCPICKKTLDQEEDKIAILLTQDKLSVVERMAAVAVEAPFCAKCGVILLNAEQVKQVTRKG